MTTEHPLRFLRFDADIDAAIDRRERVFRSMRRCDACGSEQVQCRAWWSNPTLWRCRRCKHDWTQEVTP